MRSEKRSTRHFYSRVALMLRGCTHFVAIARPVNVIITAIAVFIGYGLSHDQTLCANLLLLIAAAMCATAYGNAINDIKDVASDAISHPGRPLPRGVVTPAQAVVFAVCVGAAGLTAGFAVSIPHGLGVLVPVIFLTLYAMRLKGTPLAGNLLVSLMVAYPLLFGAMNTVHMPRLLMPALLAFILNLEREIIKDLQDVAGDRTTGTTTTAILPPRLIRALLAVCSTGYLACLYIPFFRHDFGIGYAVVATALIVPIHLARAYVTFALPREKHLGLISTLIKAEMMLGLAAIAADGMM